MLIRSALDLLFNGVLHSPSGIYSCAVNIWPVSLLFVAEHPGGQLSQDGLCENSIERLPEVPVDWTKQIQD